MSDLGDRLLPFKQRAQRHKKSAVRERDQGNNAQSQEEFEEAKYAIDEAFEEIKRSSEADLSSVGLVDQAGKDHASELADCWGILGGIYREWPGRIGDAIDAYETGYDYEKEPKFEISSTYNTVNRLAVRLLDNPGLLKPDAPMPNDPRLDKPIQQLLAEAGAAIETKWRLMTDPVWALADMVLITTLLQMPDSDRWESLLKEKAQNRFPFESLATMAKALAQAPLPSSARLEALAARLKHFVESRWPSPGAVGAV